MEIEPFLGGFQACCRQGTSMLPAANRSLNQPGVFEDLHVLADGRLADLKGRRKFANGCAALCKSCQDAAASTVGKGEKDPVKLLVGLLHGINS